MVIKNVLSTLVYNGEYKFSLKKVTVSQARENQVTEDLMFSLFSLMNEEFSILLEKTEVHFSSLEQCHQQLMKAIRIDRLFQIFQIIGIVFFILKLYQKMYIKQ